MASVQEVDKYQRGTVGTLVNQTPNAMTLSRSHNWFGSPVGGSFPEAISADGVAEFTHFNAFGVPSKAGVVYEGVTAKGGKCAWVLAWLAPANLTPTTPNKVYAACGAKSVIDNMTWDQIAMNLESSDIIIPVPGPACVDAAITHIPEFAALRARFYHKN